MRLDDFKDLLDTYGADLQSWPSAEQSAAFRLISTNISARRVYEEVVAWEDVLMNERVPPPRPDAVSSVMQSVENFQFEASIQQAAVCSEHPERLSLNGLRALITEVRQSLIFPELVLGACAAGGLFLGGLQQVNQSDIGIDIVSAYIFTAFVI